MNPKNRRLRVGERIQIDDFTSAKSNQVGISFTEWTKSLPRLERDGFSRLGGWVKVTSTEVGTKVKATNLCAFVRHYP